MIRSLGLILVIVSYVFPTALAHADPLFDQAETLSVTLAADFRQMNRDRDKALRYPAKLTVADETLNVDLGVRGNNRLKKETCGNPPLRVYFGDDIDSASVFHRQSDLKLVVQCDNSKRFEQLLRLEFLAYQLFSLVSDESFKVRWLDVTFDDGKRTKQQPGIFIERKKRMGKRLDIQQVKANSIAKSLLDPYAAVRLDVFQYMLGNLDYSEVRAPGEEDCCHNVKLMGAEAAAGGYIPIPYDFDSSGFVDAPYAVPPDSAKVKSVTTRRYRGFCSFNEQLPTVLEQFRRQQPAMIALIDNDPILNAGARKKARRFLGKFFTTINNEKKTKKEFLDRCR